MLAELSQGLTVWSDTPFPLSGPRSARRAGVQYTLHSSIGMAGTHGWESEGHLLQPLYRDPSPELELKVWGWAGLGGASRSQ